MTGATGLRAAALLWITLCSLFAASAHAHTPSLSVLALDERSPGEFIARWERTQGIQDAGAAYDLLKPVFPEHCRFAAPRLDCGARGLSGRVGFDGLGDLSSSGMIKIQWVDGSTRTLSLTAAQPHVRVSEVRHDAGALRGVSSFIWLGITHIWLGLDHLLFVVGLFWLLDSWRVLITTVTAFTIAHSLTLGTATLGLPSLPTAPVEAVIALSIAFVAVEIAGEARTKQPSLTRQRPWLVAFAFGLLHGFGFASALAELEIAGAERPIVLLCFNVGVEIGQLVFIAGLLALRAASRRLERASGVRLAIAGYYAMGTLAMYWFFERIVAFMPSV
ncbi:HupE/UreJ family protein [Sorangium sp. So ce1036]|uniref:HupE/UreJ family protein n=1 Tax=Sorangium sp. So ce1036 TaxID=3133328 RepID=UPI003F00A5B1